MELLFSPSSLIISTSPHPPRLPLGSASCQRNHHSESGAQEGSGFVSRSSGPRLASAGRFPVAHSGGDGPPHQAHRRCGSVILGYQFVQLQLAHIGADGTSPEQAGGDPHGPTPAAAPPPRAAWAPAAPPGHHVGAPPPTPRIDRLAGRSLWNREGGPGSGAQSWGPRWVGGQRWR